VSYVDGKADRVYDVLGLRAKGQMLEPWYVPGGLGGPSRMESDLRADMADVGRAALGGGDERCRELGREGEARGMMSLGSGFPDA